ncbi:MAG TPA: NAD(P)-dependent oxidoreductase [Candidatus Lokiarchaeia archaeon]|nr:NAD(P)-dependent oxidoreductase [Candidatus Lokiarchaeia archaeon]
MKIFVTGGSGFIGQRIVDNLLQNGHELVCLTHQKELERPGITTVQGYLLEKDSLAGMKDCDAVIANAAIYVIGPDDATREIMPDINVTGTKNTLDLAVDIL